MARSTRAGARKLFERIVRRRRDMQRLIPYRTCGWSLDQRVASLADQPLCSDELDDQLSSLLCQLIHQQQFQPQFATALAAEIGSRLAALVLIEEHASRAWPSSAVAVFEIE